MKPRVKIAILDMYDNVPNEGMRCLKSICGRFLAQDGIIGNYDIFNVRGNNEIPALEEYDIFVSSGGPGSPIPVGETWEPGFYGFIQSLWEHNQSSENKKFLFAICHSFQMIAGHFNVGMVSKRRSTSFGVMPVHRLKDGDSELFFDGLPDLFYAVDSRDYQLTDVNEEVINTLNIKLLAIEKERPHVPLERAVMAIRFSEEIFGTQFHPEADAEGMLRYFLKEEKKMAVINEHGQAKYEEMIDRLDDPDKILLTEATIIPKFLQYAYSQLVVEDLV
jgi:homoserine O-succinyltransferase/O-acetyltransferase